MSVKNDAATPSERLASVEDMLLYRLGQLTAAAGAMVVRLCEGGYGITRREWAVLAQLHGQPDGMLPSVLAERMHRDRARTSRTLTALQAKGLVQRMVLPHNRRSVRMSLTPAGQALYDELMPQVQAINARILQALAPEQKQAFDAALEQLRLQARQLLGEMAPALPKADRRRGGRNRAVP
jgi:DNA-binding MarR family transcriptional regulator